ncbi:hypothetical protein [Amycolatopsis sp. 195334CR]|nr:hypothetical protein [Amycolatopsis sp. 195334CR]MBN6037456.1 hypothetical protein [Amycolatopsis sp. 195334CR]
MWTETFWAAALGGALGAGWVYLMIWLRGVLRRQRRRTRVIGWTGVRR